ncbi:hypothetical protein DFH09DRAFT_554527 [Mycena vulgaris]|nr:hypothetical protein DFH09DRAFT_554527 [Mycena vulgaris]
MPPVHKLRKMDNLDIEKTRDDELAEKTGETAQERQEAEGSTSKGAESPENAFPSLRPLTRSLTGRASKPRARDDSWYEAPKKGAAGRKKAKPTRKRTIDEVDKAESEEPQDPPAAPEHTVPHPAPPLNSTQAAFVDGQTQTSVDPLAPPPPPSFDNRRSRANLPIPVPNLIKKSRGRRVPIIAGSGEEEATKRMHVCKVEGCGKCFHRGEHLKRHIRSIHTHEKPFPCTFPSCNKFFNRHDNLLQHVKVHRNGDDDIDIDADGSPAPDDSRPASPSNDSFDSARRIASLPIHHHSTAITYPTLGAPMTYGSTTQSSSYATNMAVSSLRTELPDSPSKGLGESSYTDAQPYAQHHDLDHDQHQDHDDRDERDERDDQHYVHPALHPADVDATADSDSDADADAEAEADPAPPPSASTAESQYVFPDPQKDTPMHQDPPADAQPEHPQPNGHVMQLPPQHAPQPQSYYRLRTPPPPPLAPAMAQPQEWQATF